MADCMVHASHWDGVGYGSCSGLTSRWLPYHKQTEARHVHPELSGSNIEWHLVTACIAMTWCYRMAWPRRKPNGSTNNQQPTYYFAIVSVRSPRNVTNIATLHFVQLSRRSRRSHRSRHSLSASPVCVCVVH